VLSGLADQTNAKALVWPTDNLENVTGHARDIKKHGFSLWGVGWRRRPKIDLPAEGYIVNKWKVVAEGTVTRLLSPQAAKATGRIGAGYYSNPGWRLYIRLENLRKVVPFPQSRLVYATNRKVMKSPIRYFAYAVPLSRSQASPLFTPSDFDAFQDHKTRNKNYNEERKIPWDKLKDIRSDLTPKLRKLAINLEGHVSRHSIHPIYGSDIYDMWLSYTKPNQPRYFELPQLQINILKPRIFVGIAIPPKSRDAQKRLLNLFLNKEFIRRMRDLPAIGKARFYVRHGSRKMWLPNPKSLQQPEVLKFSDDEPGKDWMSLGYWFDRNDERLKTRKFVDLSAEIMSKLLWIYLEITGKSSRFAQLSSKSVRIEKREPEMTHSRVIESLSDLNRKKLRKDLADLRVTFSRDELEERTQGHQDLVKKLYSHYDNAGFECRQGRFDLFVQGRKMGLLHEMKTVDRGNLSDERKRVVEAIGQLAYYEHFDVPEVLAPDSRLFKFVVMQAMRAPAHIRFLEENSMNVLWMSKEGNIEGNEKSLRILKKFMSRPITR